MSCMGTRLSTPGSRVLAAREAVLKAAREAFAPGPVWLRTQAWLNASHELVEAEAAAEAVTQPDLDRAALTRPAPPSAGGPPFPGRSPSR